MAKLNPIPNPGNSTSGVAYFTTSILGSYDIS